MAGNSSAIKEIKSGEDAKIDQELAAIEEMRENTSNEYPQTYLEMRVDELLKTIEETMKSRDQLVDHKIQAAQKQMEVQVLDVEKKLEGALKPVNDVLDTVIYLTTVIKTMLENIKKNSQSITKMVDSIKELSLDVDEIFEIIEEKENA